MNISDGENMDYAKLNNDIRNNPNCAIFINNGNDRAIMDLYNAQTSIKYTPQIPISQVLIWAGSGPFATIIDAANNQSSPVRSAALTAIHLFGSVSNVDVSLPQVPGMLQAFVATGVITSGQYNSFMDMAYSPGSSGEALFGTGTTITVNDISMALRGYM